MAKLTNLEESTPKKIFVYVLIFAIVFVAVSKIDDLVFLLIN